MIEFYVDPAGLGRLSAQLTRASDDARATLDYTRQHCDLAWNAEGLLMIAIGPHEHVYGNITGALTKLQQYAHSRPRSRSLRMRTPGCPRSSAMSTASRPSD